MREISIETIGGRIRHVRLAPESGKKTLDEMSDSLGITRAQLLTYELNKVVPTDAILKLISYTYNVNYHWLKTGIGEPFPPLDDPAAYVDKVLAGQNDVAKIILAEACRVLDDHAWQKIGEMVQAVADRLRGHPDDDA
ncbi:MAG: helix-turn-helix domain-containing protein [Clostridiales bacterium]|nr:helix-turn-helix domain-containing protein [Clostridiales bacterium]